MYVNNLQVPKEFRVKLPSRNGNCTCKHYLSSLTHILSPCIKLAVVTKTYRCSRTTGKIAEVSFIVCTTKPKRARFPRLRRLRAKIIKSIATTPKLKASKILWRLMEHYILKCLKKWILFAVNDCRLAKFVSHLAPKIDKKSISVSINNLQTLINSTYRVDIFSF